MEDMFLKPSEVARMLHVHTRTVINMIRDGKLKSVTVSGKKRKSYRIHRKEIDRFMAEEYERMRKGAE